MPSAGLAPVCFFFPRNLKQFWTGVIRLALCSFVYLFVCFGFVSVHVKVFFVSTNLPSFVFPQQCLSLLKEGTREETERSVFFARFLFTVVGIVGFASFFRKKTNRLLFLVSLLV